MDNKFENRSFSNADDNIVNDNDDSNFDTEKDLLAGLGREISSNNNLIQEEQAETKQQETKPVEITNKSSENLPPIFNHFPKLIKDLYKAGISFTMNQLGEIIIKDFYRPSTMVMNMNNEGKFILELRKELITINSISDLTDLNYKEWKKTGKGKGNYATPAKCWADLFAEKGLAKRQMVFVPVDED